jgi:thiamine-phosphate pyrophosphorylase
MPHPDRFYPVVDSVAWVVRLAKLGVRTVQLRVKNISYPEAVALVRETLASIQDMRTELVVNDHWQAAIAGGAKHVHLGHEDLLEADVPAIRRAGLTLGLSTHDGNELDTALNAHPDYIAFGPIYETTLKKMRFAPQGLDRIGQWKRAIGPIPLVAIGGITLERAPGVFAAGADSISVVSDITQNPDPDARVKAWLDLVAETA